MRISIETIFVGLTILLLLYLSQSNYSDNINKEKDDEKVVIMPGYINPQYRNPYYHRYPHYYPHIHGSHNRPHNRPHHPHKKDEVIPIIPLGPPVPKK
jgi:hypothetical protein